MKTLARTIAAIFMILGVVVIMLGVAMAVTGFPAVPAVQAAYPGLTPDLTGISVLVKIAAGAVISFQGLSLTAIGAALWLLSTIAEETERTGEYMTYLARRQSPPGK